MALNKVTFNINKSGLGKPLASLDHYSGLIVDSSTFTLAPTAIFSVADLKALNIIQGSVATGLIYKQVADFFTQLPKGVLYLQVTSLGATPDYKQLEDLQKFADYNLRQVTVVLQREPVATDVTALKAVVNRLINQYAPLVVVLATTTFGTKTVSTLISTATLASDEVVVLVSKDQKSAYPAGGLALGAIAKAKVNESVAWRGKFNLANGSEYDKIELVTGEKFESLSESALKDKGYMFMTKIPNLPGTYFEDSLTATDIASDFSTIENNRTMHKALRNINAKVTPLIASPVNLRPEKLPLIPWQRLSWPQNQLLSRC